MKVGDKVVLILDIGRNKKGTELLVTELSEGAVYVSGGHELDWVKPHEVKVISNDVSETSSQSARHNQGKVQLREVDPAFIIGLGEVLTAARGFYDEGNWQKETKFSTPYESAQRHLLKFWSGQELDDQTGKHHLLHAATNLMFLFYHLDSGKGIDDRLFKKEKK